MVCVEQVSCVLDAVAVASAVPLLGHAAIVHRHAQLELQVLVKVFSGVYYAAL